jgi:putative ABC transport system permease protein
MGAVSDLVYGARILVRRPRYAIAAIVVLTLGVGASTAVFSFINAILLKPLPLRDPNGIVLVWETNRRNSQIPLSWPDLNDIRQQAASLSQTFAMTAGFFTMSGSDVPEQVTAALVSPEVFDVLGVTPARGRTLIEDDDAPGRDKVAVLGYQLWQERFGGREDVVGRQVTLNDQTYRIVGIMPHDFWFLARDFQIWVPFQPTADAKENRSAHVLFVAGRLKHGVTLRQAQAEVSSIAASLAQTYPATNRALGARVARLPDEILQNVQPTLTALFGAVLFLLLLACANLANLVLTHAVEREREIAIRVAMGGNRWRIVRMFLAESVLLAGIAASLGVFVARACIPAFASLFPTALPIPVPGLENVRIDRTALVFSIVVSIVTTLVVSLAPVLSATRVNPSDSLKEGGRTSGGRRNKFRRMLLATAEIALAVVLLIGAGLMTQSFLRLQNTALGFNPKQVLTMKTPLPRFRYPDNAARMLFYTSALERLRALPAVSSAGFIDVLPLSGVAGQVAVRLLSSAPDETLSALSRVADAAYFSVMEIPLRRGRLFAEQDGPGSAPVAVVSETMARQLWRSAEPIGETFILANGSTPIQVVGVVGDVRHWVGAAPEATFYRPYQQVSPSGASFVIRTSGPPLDLAVPAQQTIWAIDRDQPITYLRTFDSDLADQTWAQRLSAAVLGVFAVVALVIAATGVFGVISTNVAQRTREIGIRLAMGAEPRSIVRMVVLEMTGWILLGVGAGVVGTIAVTRFLGSILYGVTETDPLTFGSVVAVTIGAAIVATYLPARVASRISPMNALSIR